MNRKKKIVTATIISTILIIVTSFIFFNIIFGSNTPITPYIPVEGEDKELMVYVEFHNSTKVKDVTVILSNTETGSSSSQVTEENGEVSFVVTVGPHYVITATSNNSTKSISVEIGSLTEIYVFISPFDKTIEHIMQYEVGVA